ncbi:MAG: major capsid protein [Polaromonas sp.]|nr:major capsid protein [Polaromonas sp.]
MSAIDVSALVDGIAGVALPIASVSVAILGIYVLIFGFKSILDVMGFGSAQNEPDDPDRHLYDHITGLAFDSQEYQELLHRFEAGMPDDHQIESSMIAAEAYHDLQRHYADDNHEARREYAENNFSFGDTEILDTSIDGKFELVDEKRLG